MAWKLKSSAWSTYNWAEFIQTTFHGQKLWLSDSWASPGAGAGLWDKQQQSEISALPSPIWKASSSRTQMVNIRATYGENVAPAHNVVKEK